ncbi:LysM peptidoglycan-binding domain-containing protein [Synergistaceae bacterium OttesenSCG-928-I11]|nr:LysM peptidoglycan-binding domain-containing protein [Synergistaceae bacterium OttesenSCG-928-I11]
MVEHVRHHKVPSKVKQQEAPETGMGVHTEEILDGMEKIQAVAALVESVIVWRAQYIAWNVDIYKAEPLLFRLIYKEGAQNPQAMDLLARIYFQQSKYEKAKDLWNRAADLQPGNPALRRTANAMNAIAKSPTAAVARHKFGVLFRGALLLVLLCLVGYGGVLGVDAVRKWAEGPIAVQNLTGRFHYAYDSVTKDMVYVPIESSVEMGTDEIVPVTVPPDETGEHDGTYNLGFTRKKVANGREFGRIEVVVERTGNTLKASGRIPNLYTRYLVEQALWEVPGITDIDMRGLQVDRTYRVNKGDSLWMIARRVYGDGTAWTLLAKANDLRDPNKLNIGQELSLPLGDEYIEIVDEQ